MMNITIDYYSCEIGDYAIITCKTVFAEQFSSSCFFPIIITIIKFKQNLLK